MSKGVKRKNPVGSSDNSDDDHGYHVGQNSIETTEDGRYGMTNKSAQESSTGVIKLEVTGFSKPKLTVQSPYHIISRLPWCFEVNTSCYGPTSEDKYLSVYIQCNPDSESTLWSCEAQVEFRLLADKQPLQYGASSSLSARAYHKEKFTHTFTYDHNNTGFDFINWEELMKPESGYVRDNTALFEAHITVRKVVGVSLNPTYNFSRPGESTLSDGVVLVGEKRIHVNKAYLALYSPVLRALFFSDFNERSMEEISLNGVAAEEFTELLSVIYPSHQCITKESVGYLLKLADKFQVQYVLDKCVDFLGTSEASSIPSAKKLLWAEKYCLANLQDICLRMLRTPGQVKAIKLSPEYALLSEKSKMPLLEKLFELLP